MLYVCRKAQTRNGSQTFVDRRHAFRGMSGLTYNRQDLAMSLGSSIAVVNGYTHALVLTVHDASIRALRGFSNNSSRPDVEVSARTTRRPASAEAYLARQHFVDIKSRLFANCAGPKATNDACRLTLQRRVRASAIPTVRNCICCGLFFRSSSCINFENRLHHNTSSFGATHDQAGSQIFAGAGNTS